MSAYYNEIDGYAVKWLRNLISAGHIAPGDVDESGRLLATRVVYAWMPNLKLVSLEARVLGVVSFPMLADVQQFQVLNAVVGFVPVDVMYVVACRDGAELRFPHVPVEVRFGADCAGVVAVRPCGVLCAAPHDEREQFLLPEFEPALREHLVHALPGDAERSTDLGETETVVIELVHLVRFVILTVCWHVNHLTTYHTRKDA